MSSEIFGNIAAKRTTKNPSSTVNITGLFFARYLGSSFLIESSITLVLIADTILLVRLLLLPLLLFPSLLFDFDIFIFLLPP